MRWNYHDQKQQTHVAFLEMCELQTQTHTHTYSSRRENVFNRLRATLSQANHQLGYIYLLCIFICLCIFVLVFSSDLIFFDSSCSGFVLSEDGRAKEQESERSMEIDRERSQPKLKSQNTQSTDDALHEIRGMA